MIEYLNKLNKKQHMLFDGVDSVPYAQTGSKKRRSVSDEDDEESDEESDSTAVMITQKTEAFREFSVHINGVIKDDESYRNISNLLTIASENDSIIFYLDTPGGNLQTTLRLISAIRATKADVSMVAVGDVSSAGTLLWLSVPAAKRVVREYSIFMFHIYTSFIGAKGHEIASRIGFNNDFYDDVLNRFYRGFLTNKEMERLFDFGTDVYIRCEEINRRNNIMIEFEEHLGSMLQSGAITGNEDKIVHIIEAEMAPYLERIAEKEMTWETSVSGRYKPKVGYNFSTTLPPPKETSATPASESPETQKKKTPSKQQNKELPNKELPKKELPKKELPKKELPKKELPKKKTS